MRRVLADRPVLVWLVLVVATVVTAVLGLEQGSGAATAVGVAMITIAFVKLRLVGIHFMELGTAPPALRSLFEGYVGLTFVVLVTLYLVI